MARKPIPITQTKEHYEVRARVAKAMAHPSRLLILDVLSVHEMCVGDLVKLVGAEQSTVSNHLAVLRNAGLVKSRREGTQSYYTVRVSCLNGFWSCIEGVLRENLAERRQAIGKPSRRA